MSLRFGVLTSLNANSQHLLINPLRILLDESLNKEYILVDRQQFAMRLGVRNNSFICKNVSAFAT
jgi:hypothetical protein